MKRPHIGRAAWPPIRHRSALLAAAWALLSPGAGAASICQWVDDTGRTQLSDRVPERYRGIAHCTSSLQYELSPAQQREAEQRAIDDRRQAREQDDNPPAPAEPGPSIAAPQPAGKRPVEVVTDTTDCATWWRIYEESGACFGPFRTVLGGMKPEAFEHCNEVPSPEPRCGPRRD
jgi:hypothetical protein